MNNNVAMRALTVLAIIATGCADDSTTAVDPQLRASSGATAAKGVSVSRWNGLIPQGHFKYHDGGSAEGNSGLKLEVKANMDADFIVSSVAVAPGGEVGWHTHNGPVFINVRKGTLTLLEMRDGTCERRDVGPGGPTILEQGTGIHNGYNLSTSETVEYATVAWAPRGVPQRVDVSPAPPCVP